jgi:hypothetical protein
MCGPASGDEGFDLDLAFAWRGGLRRRGFGCNRSGQVLADLAMGMAAMLRIEGNGFLGRKRTVVTISGHAIITPGADTGSRTMLAGQ